MLDHVYGGMTRPPTVFGVPQGIFAGLLISTILLALSPLIFKMPFILSLGGIAIGGLGYFTARLLCEHDHNFFRYLQVRLLLALKAPGRKVARGMRTYAKAPIRKR